MDAVYFPDKRLGGGVQLVNIPTAVIITDIEVCGQLAARNATGVVRAVKAHLGRNVLRAARGFDPVKPGLGHYVELVACIEIADGTEGNLQVLHLHGIGGRTVGAYFVVYFVAVFIAQPCFAAIQ